jgi:hypothetical protein
MNEPFKLVTQTISHDSIEALQTLLKQAETGNLIGVAFVAMYNQGGYLVDAAGEAYRSPTFTRGMVKALDDKMKTRVHELT